MITQAQDRKGEPDRPILYNAFSFTKTQKNYRIYKRELYTIVEFC